MYLAGMTGNTRTKDGREGGAGGGLYMSPALRKHCLSSLRRSMDSDRSVQAVRCVDLFFASLLLHDEITLDSAPEGAQRTRNHPGSNVDRNKPGTDLEATQETGDTALSLSSFFGRLGAVAELIRRGANVHCRDCEGSAPGEVFEAEVDPATQRQIQVNKTTWHLRYIEASMRVISLL